MKTFDQITIEHGADKASVHPVGAHGYARHYDFMLSPIRETALKVLEIGVGSAESIKSWLEYFPNAKVFGVDIVHDTNDWNTPGKTPDPRYTFISGDQSVEVFWSEVSYTHGIDWDLVCDDGGHASNQIITTFKMLWPHVKAGGYYAIEDLNCAYSGLSFFCPEGWPNHMNFIKDLLDHINHGMSAIDRMHYSKELCILQKKA